DDHLGSCSLELDQQAQVISQEGYYPFGATAWYARGNEVEVDYKTIRYSGQEMDDSGLYYYGARYYAPWLQRWISADPAGDVDGLNLYAFVGNNPLRYTDKNGQARFDEVIYNYANFVTVLEGYATQTLAQLDNVFHQTDIAIDLLKNFTGESINAAIGFLGGFYGAQAGGVGLPDAPHSVNFTSQGKPPFSEGLTGGNLGAELGGGASGSTLPMSGLIRPLIPQTTQMSIAAIDRQLGLSADEGPDWLAGATNIFLNNVVGSVVPGISAVLAMGSRVQEAEDMKNRLDPAKIMKIERMLDEWQTVDNQRYATADAAFDIAGADIIYPATLFPNVNGMTDSSLLEPILRSALKQQHARTQDLITRAKSGMAHYKEMGTTDNQFLLRQARDAHRQREKN
ncbi:RHS repeat-associated core domain-containing protein, partial [Pseudomonas sp. NPDC086278]|uniref:RHS repeat-associated core domain-containing protein n=1 Tax=Pseudomonas sp. NPDC086278 TaxID=3390646 RepID=UPI003CFEE166